MPNYLTRLAGHALGTRPTVQPRVPSLFEREREAFAEMPEVEPRYPATPPRPMSIGDATDALRAAEPVMEQRTPPRPAPPEPASAGQEVPARKPEEMEPAALVPLDRLPTADPLPGAALRERPSLVRERPGPAAVEEVPEVGGPERPPQGRAAAPAKRAESFQESAASREPVDSRSGTWTQGPAIVPASPARSATAAVHRLAEEPEPPPALLPSPHPSQAEPMKPHERGTPPLARDVSRAPGARGRERADETPTVRVSIGRVDVRAVMPTTPQTQPRRARPESRLVSLDDYLKGGSGGRR